MVIIGHNCRVHGNAGHRCRFDGVYSQYWPINIKGNNDLPWRFTIKFGYLNHYTGPTSTENVDQLFLITSIYQASVIRLLLFAYN